MRTAPLKSRRAGLATLATAIALTIVPAAHADVGETIILHCTHKESLSGFSQRAYSRALKELSADAEEYSDCSQQIRQAQLAAAAGRRGGSSRGVSQGVPAATTSASPSEQKRIAGAASSGAAPLNLGGQYIHPGVVHASVASALSSLPTPLLATLAFLLACLLAVGGGALRNRLRGGRQD
jgi:hypothetical protein